jgi:hypothetical protein
MPENSRDSKAAKRCVVNVSVDSHLCCFKKVRMARSNILTRMRSGSDL